MQRTQTKRGLQRHSGVGRFFRFALLLTLIASLLSCNQDKEKQAFLLQDEALVIINHKKIQLAQFQKKLQILQKNHEVFLGGQNTLLAEAKKLVVNQLIEEELIIQEAARQGVQVSQQELDAEVASALNPYPQSNFDGLLLQHQLTKEEWADRLRIILLTSRVIEQEVIQQIPITKREISAYYRKFRKELVRPRAVRFKNITLATEKDAKVIRRKLIEGKKMDELIHKFSIAPDKETGGDMGFIEKGDLPPEMENEVWLLNRTKRVSNVVHSLDGFHVFYWMKTRYRKKLKQRAATPRIKDLLRAEKQDEAYLTWIAKLKNRATISINEKLLQNEEGF